MSARQAAARAVKVPASLRPMLAVAGELPEGDDWNFELKWDGVRALGFVEDGLTHLVSRSGRDLTDTYRELADGAPLDEPTALVDGEVVALDGEGRPSFQALQSRQAARRGGRAVPPIAYLVFDVLQIGSRSLVDEPYHERRRALASLGIRHPRWSVPEAFGPPGEDVLAASRDRGLEGVVAKRRSSPYLAGRRSDAWIKVKNFRTQEVVLGGWTEGEGRRETSFGSLLLGLPTNEPSRLVYIGNVGSGFTEVSLQELSRHLVALEQRESPFSGRLPAPQSRRARFVAPTLVGEVRFSEWTADGRLRQPSWRGLRIDKRAEEVVRES